MNPRENSVPFPTRMRMLTPCGTAARARRAGALSMTAAAGLILLTTLPARAANDELDTLLDGPAPETIASVVVDGLNAEDAAAARKIAGITSGEGLQPGAVEDALKRLAAARQDWVTGRHRTEPAAGGGIRLILPVCYRHPETRIQLSDSGALTLGLGADTLVHQARPEVYFAERPAGDGSAVERLGYHEATQANRRYDRETGTVDLTHAWGSWQVSYHPAPGRLDIEVAVTNGPTKALLNLNLWLTPDFAFPETPEGYAWSQGWGADIPAGDSAPPVAMADYGRGAVAALLPQRPEGVAAGFRGKSRLYLTFAKIPAGETRRVRLSLRFGPGRTTGKSGYELVRDIGDAFVARHPFTGPKWPDRRPIAAVHPSSAELGAGTRGVTANPRGWFFENQDKGFEVLTDSSRARFRELMLAYARTTVEGCREMNAQGIICWSMEGQEYPHTISYVGAPDRLAELAPEMDAIADEWFKVFTDAGLRIGLCVRPQELLPHPGHDPKAPPNQPPYKYMQREPRKADGSDDADAALATLDRKISYARKRWECTLFYVDSNVNSDYVKDPATGKWKNTRWEVMPYTIFQELSRRHPDCLILPEHETLLYWSCAVPITAGPTPALPRALWPDAFSVNLMQTFNRNRPQDLHSAEQCVLQGDPLIIHAGWKNPDNPVILEIYRRANKK